MCRKNILVHLGNVYNMITQNGKIKMSPTMLNIFLKNFIAPEYSNLPDLDAAMSHFNNSKDKNKENEIAQMYLQQRC